MLDIEVVTQPSLTAIDIVSLDEFASHIRISPRLRNSADQQSRMRAALDEALGTLHGFDGTLNRMVLPCGLKRYLTKFPADGNPILLPYPDLIGDAVVTIEDGSSPPTVVPASSYVVKKTIVPEIWPKASWPQVAAAPRAISITYSAGYQHFPQNLKRLLKILAAHNLENPDGTIQEPRQMAINRKVEFGVDYLTSLLRVPVAYDNWLE